METKSSKSSQKEEFQSRAPEDHFTSSISLEWALFFFTPFVIESNMFDWSGESAADEISAAHPITPCVEAKKFSIDLIYPKKRQIGYSTSYPGHIFR